MPLQELDVPDHFIRREHGMDQEQPADDRPHRILPWSEDDAGVGNPGGM